MRPKAISGFNSNSSCAIPIVFEDNHLLVVVKPVNMPTQADDSGDMDLLSALKDDLKQRYEKPGNVYLGLVHRLDRPVGGIMVFAKTSKAASRLSETIRSRAMDKTYMAVVHGIPDQPKERLVHYLLKDAKTNTVRSVSKQQEGAKEAVLDYSVVSSENGLSLVNIQLLTGRSHQIRVQFATIGCPLYGDQRYGPTVNKPGQQIALWSTWLTFDHPTTKESLSFASPPPQAYPWSLWAEQLIGHFA